jgi:hypothetical protein
MILYHGSLYETQLLRPSFEITGELIKWDYTESNRYLYSSTDRETARIQVVFQFLEKSLDITRVRSTESDIYVECTNSDEEFNRIRKIIRKEFGFIYEITCRKSDGWIEVNNQNNGLTGEYKTTSSVRPDRVERFPLGEVLSNMRIFRTSPKPVSLLSW